MTFSLLKAYPLIAALTLTACMPFTKVQGDGAAEAKIKGSWTVIHDGKARIELTPPATMVFETAGKRITGFDGCNNYQGNYMFEGGLIRARLASTRMACRDATASAVSTTLNKLFAEGAEVVELEMMGAKVLTLRNKSTGAELRLGATEQLQQKK